MILLLFFLRKGENDFSRRQDLEQSKDGEGGKMTPSFFLFSSFLFPGRRTGGSTVIMHPSFFFFYFPLFSKNIDDVQSRKVDEVYHK